MQNFGNLYELGLAHVNKSEKRENGVYYTPRDVVSVLADNFIELKGSNICDVCCGVGNLIIGYLEKCGRRKALELLKNGRIYLYDMDDLAVEICKVSIGLNYGFKYIDNINCIIGDFLSDDIHLPDNSKVISNPPYYKIVSISDSWKETDVIKDSKELYAAFMEKIIIESKSSVLITPFSFIGGDKFYSLRKLLNNYSGYIYSFDNVPGNIFKGKKHGVFNSNTSNAVRAAITVVNNVGEKGFCFTPLIRFSSAERDNVLNKSFLDSLLLDIKQTVNDKNKKYVKCFSSVYSIYESWVSYSSQTLGDLICNDKTDFCLCVPKTCRYYTSASVKALNRVGKSFLYFKDKETLEYVYCMLNSSFAYLYWRIFDGAINYSDSLLKSMPVFFNNLSFDDKCALKDIASEMILKEDSNMSYKKNASVLQENVKFDISYRRRLNSLLLKLIKSDSSEDVFDIVHSNSILTEGV